MFKKLLNIVLIGYCFIYTNLIIAQTEFPKGIYVEGSFHFGKILRHTPKIAIPIHSYTFGGEVSFEHQMYGKKQWQSLARFPRVGAVLSYQNFGDTLIGKGIGIMPHVSVDFVRTKFFRLYGRLAMGFAYLTEHYQLPHNPYNNIVGSHFNNNTAFRFGMAFRVHRNWEIRPTFSFTHYSNGASQLPNYGINVTSLHVGLCYMPNPVEKEDRIKPDTMPKISRKLRYNAMYSMGFRESITYGGPKYPIYLVAADVGMNLTHQHRLKLGFEYESNGATQAFLKNTGVYSDASARWQASRIALYTGIEIMWGHVTLGVNLDFYVTRNSLQPYFLYERLIGRYYLFNTYKKVPVNPYLGLTLKAHKIVAEYFSVCAGASF